MKIISAALPLAAETENSPILPLWQIVVATSAGIGALVMIAIIATVWAVRRRNTNH